jgi:hypothetical protein
MPDLDERWVVDWDVALPERMSVTLGRKADVCPRDAGMYLKYRGQASAGQLLRGSLGHLVFERVMGALIDQGEESLVAAQPGEDPMRAAGEVSQTTKEWVDAIVDELRLPLSESEIDEVRVMAYHFAIGNEISPSTVVALEKSFVLDLPSGGQMIGKVDLAALQDGILRVRDYKTSFYVPPGEDVSKLVQVPWYAAGLLWGRPYEREKCRDCYGDALLTCKACGSRDGYPKGTYEVVEPSKRLMATCTGCETRSEQVEHACPACESRGYTEVFGEPLGQDVLAGVQWVWCEQVYPRFLNPTTGMMSTRTAQAPDGSDLWGLADLRDKLAAADRVWRRVQHGAKTREWPAKSGDHCSECTAQAECPIPSVLRRHAGEITSVDQAAEAKEWAVRQAALVKATNLEIQRFMKAEGLAYLEVGEDRYGFVVSHPRALKKAGKNSDWEGLQDAVERAQTFGEEFDVNDWLTAKPKTDFRKVKVEAADAPASDGKGKR